MADFPKFSTATFVYFGCHRGKFGPCCFGRAGPASWSCGVSSMCWRRHSTLRSCFHITLGTTCHGQSVLVMSSFETKNNWVSRRYLGTGLRYISRPWDFCLGSCQLFLINELYNVFPLIFELHCFDQGRITACTTRYGSKWPWKGARIMDSHFFVFGPVQDDPIWSKESV